MKKGEKVKTALLEAAVKLVAERGDTEYAALHEIAAQAGVPLS